MKIGSIWLISLFCSKRLMWFKINLFINISNLRDTVLRISCRSINSETTMKSSFTSDPLSLQSITFRELVRVSSRNYGCSWLIRLHSSARLARDATMLIAREHSLSPTSASFIIHNGSPAWRFAAEGKGGCFHYFEAAELCWTRRVWIIN